MVEDEDMIATSSGSLQWDWTKAMRNRKPDSWAASTIEKRRGYWFRQGNLIQHMREDFQRWRKRI